MSTPLPSSRLAALTLVGAVFAACALGLFVDVMDVDSAQYAHISREMLERGDFLIVTNRYQDYLDKPPLVLWLGALSYALLGFGTFAYKLPSFLLALLAVGSTWRLGALLYDARVGNAAALLLGTCQAFFLMTNDVRTDAALMGTTAFALWQVAEFELRRTWRALALAGVGVGAAMLAKGPIGLMVPALALASHLALRGEWRSLAEPRWLISAVIVALLLAPMVWGLYRQFGWRGPEFFFWTQSFGRITGSNPSTNATTPLFFTHTFLWTFLPWPLLFLGALGSRLRGLLRSRLRLAPGTEGFTLGGFLLPFAALSLSQYKLPHYIFILFPLASVLAAAWVVGLADAGRERALRRLAGVQLAVCAGLWALGALLAAWVFPMRSPGLWSLYALAAAAALGAYQRVGSTLVRALAPAAITMAGLNLVLNGHFYPELLKYQSPTVAARILGREMAPGEEVYSFRASAYSFDFYLGRSVLPLPDPESVVARVRKAPLWLYTNEEGREELRALPLRVDREVGLDHFHVTVLTGKFLNPATRPQALKRRYLVRVH